MAELCLELLFTVLLRNRDRISALWPRVYDHFQVGDSCWVLAGGGRNG